MASGGPGARLRAVLRHTQPRSDPRHPAPDPHPTPSPSAGVGDLRLSAGRTLVVGEDIMIGCAPIDAKSAATPTVHALLRAGVKHFDTAPLYGGSEQCLGDALASADPTLLEGVQVHTKCGLEGAGGEADFTAPSIRQRFARSLARFHLDESGGGQPYTCHTLRVHHPALAGPAAGSNTGDRLAEVLHPTEGAVAAMVGLREEGAVREVSMGMNTTVDHNGVEPTIALLQQAPAGAFDSVLFA